MFIKWTQFYNKFSQLNNLQIPRHAIGNNHILLDIHCFCDASLQAYASCVYLRSINSEGKYETHLLCSKTKVSPLKPTTVPRLELCAALLGAQLMQQVLGALAISIPVYYWSDSQIVLCWIKKEPNQLQPFVGNRVSKIQTLSNINDWYYIKTNENPSDLATRGVLPENLVNLRLWWHGPKFLSCPIDQSLIKNDETHDFIIPELKKSSILLTTRQVDNLNLFNRFSCINKLRRVVSYCIRFISNLRKIPQERIYGQLNVTEINNANIILLKLAQLDSFSKEISLLKTDGKILEKHNKLSCLSPFIDNTGILRVGGRLKFSELQINQKHPIILSSKHPNIQLQN